ncbi:hypothetical protein Dimus_008779 [Dionaea muscipula]
MMDVEAFLRSNCPVLTHLAEDLARSSWSETMVNSGYLPQNESATFLSSLGGNWSTSTSPAAHVDTPSNNSYMDPTFLSFGTKPGANLENSTLITDTNSTCSATRPACNLRSSCPQLPEVPVLGYSSGYEEAEKGISVGDGSAAYIITESTKNITYPAVPLPQKLRGFQQPIRSQKTQPAAGQVSRVVGGQCARRLMLYQDHMRSRPTDNNITYWKRFVAVHYAPKAKKKWCLSKLANVRNHPHSIFCQATQCGICRSDQGKGFEITAEALPRLYKINFDGGVVEELLHVELPCESILPSGLMVLESKSAVMETVYPNSRVFREGKLRIIFSQQLKILSWEFCAVHLEELVSHKSIAPQVDQLLDAAKTYQTSTEGSQWGIVPEQELYSNFNSRIVGAGCQLANNLEVNAVRGFGFSEEALRYFLVAEAGIRVGDLISYTFHNNLDPLATWKRFKDAYAEELGPPQGLYTDDGGGFMPRATGSFVLNPYEEFLMKRLMTSNPSTRGSEPNPHHLAPGVSNHRASYEGVGAQLSFPSTITSFDQVGLNQQQVAVNKQLEETAAVALDKSTSTKAENPSMVGRTKAGGSLPKGRGAGGPRVGKVQKATRGRGVGSASTGGVTRTHEVFVNKGYDWTTLLS